MVGRVVSAGPSVGGRWESANVDGDALSEADWQMLLGFEEWIPEGGSAESVDTSSMQTDKPGKKKKNKKKGGGKNKEESEKDDEKGMEVDEEMIAEKTKGRKKGGKGSTDIAQPSTKASKKVKRPAPKREEESVAKKAKGEDEAGHDDDGGSDDEGEEMEGEPHDQPSERVDTTEWEAMLVPSVLVDNIATMGIHPKGHEDMFRFSTPTEIQREVLPSALSHRMDIIGAAETGSGKTMAYAIPAIARLLEEERVGGGPRVLILAPTRELALQVSKQVAALIKGTDIKAASIVGGLSHLKQERLMRRHPEIIVATPGRLWALMDECESSSYLGDWSELRCLVIDETDRMVEKGHFQEMTHIVNRIKTQCKSTKMQTLVFSATLTFCNLPAHNDAAPMDADAKIARLVTLLGLRKERKVVDLTAAKATSASLTESRVNCDNLLGKDASLVYMIRRYSGRSIIFCNSVDACKRLYGILTSLRLPAFLLHAKMQQRARLKNLDRFTQRPDSILLATDVAARGLDIKGIQHVYHYQVPRTAELYLHRSGRTARASHRGLSILFVDPSEAPLYRKMCANLNRAIELPVFPVDCRALFDAIKEQVKAASELDAVSHQVRKRSQRETWFEKAAIDADIDLDFREGESEKTKTEIVALEEKERRLRGHLKALLQVPLPDVDRANLPSTKYVTAKLVKQSDDKMAREAVDTVTASQKTTKEFKKKARALSTRNVSFKKKGKKGK